ncbi:MAG: HAD hydrolase family protein [Acidobacteria bacterium]|nr:HAD hydrolase family protein [Acidobacteriota bacterium]
MANELVFDSEDRVTGEVVPRVPFDGKDLVLKGYLEELGLDPANCLAVGDGANDIPVFRMCGYAMAFNPARELEAHADAVVTGEDLGVLVSEFDRLSRARGQCASPGGARGRPPTGSPPRQNSGWMPWRRP